MPEIVRTPAASPSTENLPRIALRVDRDTLAMPRWRGVAEDGRDFSFELTASLEDGSIIFTNDEAVYFIEQLPEPVLEFSAKDAADAARLGWAVGNEHLPMEIEGTILRIADDAKARQVLNQCGVEYQQILTVLHPIQPAG